MISDKLHYNPKIQILTNSVRFGYHFFIKYQLQQEDKLITDLHNKCIDYLILKKVKLDALRVNKFYILDYSCIEFNQLFNANGDIDTDYCKLNAINSPFDCSDYVYFYLVPDSTAIIDKNSLLTYRYNYGKIMIDTVTKAFEFSKLCVLHDCICLIFSSNDLTSFCNNQKVLLLFGGIGDLFITFSIIQEYILKNFDKEIYVANKSKYANDCNKKLDFIIESFTIKKLKKLTLVNFNDYFWKYYTEVINDVASIFNKEKDSSNHMAFLYSRFLLNYEYIDFFKYNSILNSYLLNSVEQDELIYINGIISSNMPNVGIQYFTGNKIDNDNWEIMLGRKWDTENVVNFFSLCKEKNINLISLNSDTFDSTLEKYCTQKLSIAGYALLISKMNLVIGVDSSAGHIASFYDIPSITLWGKGTPINFWSNNKYHLGYRPLRNNLSLVPVNHDISSITANLLMEKVIDILTNKFVFKKDLITYRDTQDDLYVTYI